MRHATFLILQGDIPFLAWFTFIGFDLLLHLRFEKNAAFAYLLRYQIKLMRCLGFPDSGKETKNEPVKALFSNRLYALK